jgi:hypothetical protein
MGPSVFLRRAALGAGLLLGPLLSGCFVPVGAAWPSVAVTPPLRANAEADQVRAFRVETAQSVGSLEFSGENEYVMREVPVAAGGWVSPQAAVACDYCWYCNFIALSYGNLKHHTVRVRLYRPGCETVEVDSWDLPHQVTWTGVADLAGEEKGVDDLMTARQDRWREMMVRQDREAPQGPDAERLFGGLAPGSKSPEHRKALLFAAAEYQRLAKRAREDPASQAIRPRLEQKAAWLREQAEK